MMYKLKVNYMDVADKCSFCLEVGDDMDNKLVNCPFERLKDFHCFAQQEVGLNNAVMGGAVERQGQHL